jgi:hypothetical protein
LTIPIGARQIQAGIPRAGRGTGSGIGVRTDEDMSGATMKNTIERQKEHVEGRTVHSDGEAETAVARGKAGVVHGKHTSARHGSM